MREENCNTRYLAGFEFPDNLKVQADLATAVNDRHCFLLAIPSQAFRTTLQQLKHDGVPEDAVVIWATKGFDKQGPGLLSQAVEQELGNAVAKAVISGPSFASEVAADLPTAITVAGDSPAVSQQVAQLFHGGSMRVYTNPDLIGVQIGGAVKNVMAIAAGISDGLGFGANARAAIITRGLAEISRLGVAMGAESQSFNGLAGMGDLVLTCTDDQSRNRQLGLALGQGTSLKQARQQICQQVEGYSSSPEVIRLAEIHGVEMPICEQVHQVLYHNVSAHDAVSRLLSRQLGEE